MLARRTLSMLAVAALACENPVGVEKIPLVTGQWCSSTTPVVTRSGGDATVQLQDNTTTYRDVRRSDGVLIRQEVRGCQSKTCYFTGAAGYADSDLVTRCRG